MGVLAKSAVGVGLAGLVLAGLAGCGQAQPAADCGELSATRAWVTPAHAGSREMLGYMQLHNDGSQDVVVESVSSSQFDRALFQDKSAAANSADDASGGAQPLAPFTVPAGGDFNLAPNKREIALYSPSQAYRTGDQVELKLVCGRDQATLSVPAVVRSGDDDDMSLPPTDDDTVRTEEALKQGKGDTDGVSTTDDSRTAN
ncbi:copper chaperone PCu(A)C [Salinisphaera sp. Q1T1-3]|uniref:copper chaperone PCu(A)C n=1 Tax=Salinisphaera sp. Q1T1-3 TaxID=2321229 RepID=UPI000E74AF0A|nr:copper chaperone PCu(A)C [Salinisphaera sp. Q1T1-3]RJS93369.1 copper chaperone PCu(A)C [Salinisphaera sp. Q1T1-3]